MEHFYFWQCFIQNGHSIPHLHSIKVVESEKHPSTNKTLFIFIFAQATRKNMSNNISVAGSHFYFVIKLPKIAEQEKKMVVRVGWIQMQSE